MQVREKAGQTITEPVTANEFKTYIGYTGTDQDTLIGEMIKAARLFLESRCSFSAISKVYQVQFERSDCNNGWYRLPMAPVVSIDSVEIDDTAVSYESKGLDTIEIYPEKYLSTGTADNLLDVEFTAGASNALAKLAIMRIVSDIFNYREDFAGDVNIADLSFDTMKLVNSLNANITI